MHSSSTRSIEKFEKEKFICTVLRSRIPVFHLTPRLHVVGVADSADLKTTTSPIFSLFFKKRHVLSHTSTHSSRECDK